MLKHALARFQENLIHLDDKTHSHNESYHWRTFCFYIFIKLFKKFKYPFVNKETVAKITFWLAGQDSEKAASRAANRIAGNHN